MAFRHEDESNKNVAPGDILEVIHDFLARSPDELSLTRGDRIELIERDDDFGDGWYLGKHLQDARTGLFPEVYTKLATKAQALENGARHSRSSSSPATSNAPTSSISSVLNQDSDPIAFAPDAESNPPASMQATTPAPLNTPATSQRAVSAPSTGFLQQPLAGALNAQRSISMVMDNSKAHGEESPVMNETLSVIDEHITDMNTPRSSLLASGRRNANDSASDYSSHIDHRLSYITGNETDEEEADALTEAEVAQWSPTQTAEYLQELGVEERHCEIFKEQEISGEVLLNIDKSSIFMKEFDLGSVGRRLATWHKIKSFQDGVKSVKGRQRTSAPEGDGSVVGSIGGSTSISQASTNGSMLPKVPYYTNHSPQLRHSRQNSPRFVSEPQTSGFEGDNPGIPRIYSSDTTARPSAASVRDYNHHRRHSSIDFSKSDASSSMHTATGATPPTSPNSAHKKQPSLDRNWSMSAFPPPSITAQSRASTMLGLSTLGMAGPALPFSPDRNAITPSAENVNPLDFDRGYLSSGEAESRKNRNVLRKNHPGNASHSRQNSHKEGNGMKRHSRFGSAGSIMEAITSVTNSSNRQSSSDASKARARTQSLKDTNSSMATLPSNSSSTNTSTPIVTKLEYSESPTSVTSKSNPASPATKSEGFTPFGSVTSKLRTTLRSASDTTGGNSEKTHLVSPASMRSPIEENSLQPPARARAKTNFIASKSFEFDSNVDHSNKMVTILPASRTPSLGTKKAKNKKETSAYRSLMVISPQKALQTSTHSGWMYKKSAKMTSAFKSRFFVLRDRRLSYYYSLNDKIEKGLIDINSHRVMFVENDIMTSLYSTLAGTKSNPNSPANAPSGEGNDLQKNPEKTAGGPFFFKLVPPRTGLSKAVQFTRPAVHYFAVDSYQEGREWFLALKKASIDRDETQPVTSTYSQKTISLAKAQEMKQRPPALMNADENADAGSDRASKDEHSNPENPGLNIDGLNLGYDSDPTRGKSENGTPESSVPNSATLPDLESRRPQSDEPRTKTLKASNESGSTLRMVKSMSGGLSRKNSTTAETSSADDSQNNVKVGS